MGECKTKAIKANLGIFRHNQAYPGIIHVRAFLEPCVTLIYLKLWCIQNPGIFRTKSILRARTYSQPWCIQNPAIFRMLAYSKSEAYSEPCHTSTMKH